MDRKERLDRERLVCSMQATNHRILLAERMQCVTKVLASEASELEQERGLRHFSSTSASGTVWDKGCRCGKLDTACELQPTYTANDQGAGREAQTLEATWSE